MSPLSPALALAVLVVSVLAAALGVLWVVEGRERWRALATDRLLYGVPWGTLVVCVFVLAVYLLVQGGLRHWSEPLVLPFRAWSYLYPTGVLASSFAHSSPGHLVGNLTAAVVLGPLVEYAWGHYPGGSRSGLDRTDPNARRDPAGDDGAPASLADGGSDPVGRAAGEEPVRESDADVSGPRRWLRVPWVRALVAFPAAVLGVGLVTSLFFAGPVVGFSGVVFALGGVAVVRYPVATMVALLLSGVVRTVARALLDPVVVQGVSGSAPSPPSWARIAVQAHGVGVLVGVVLGLALVQARGRRVRAGRVFLAVLVYAVSRDLWAVYWFAGDGQYVLLRGVGVVLVVVLALLVTVAAAASDRPVTESLRHLPAWATPRRVAGAWLGTLALGVVASAPASRALGWPLLPAVGAAAALATLLALPLGYTLLLSLDGEVPAGRHVALATLVFATTLLGGLAIYPNAVTLGEDPVPGDGGVTVEDYVVTYEEDVRNGQIPAVDLPVLRDQTTQRTSGVIVVSRERQAWSTAITRARLASEGSGTVVVGGVGWRESVHVQRRGWSVAGNGSAYAVDLRARGETVRSFESEPATAEPRVAGHRLTLAPTADGFAVRASRDGQRVGEAPVPTAGTETTLGDVEVHTQTVDGRRTLFAETGDTRVRIATRERYR